MYYNTEEQIIARKSCYFNSVNTIFSYLHLV